MATITQIRTGKWRAQIRKRGYPNRSRYFRTKKDAQIWATAIENQIYTGQFRSVLIFVEN